ncbi:DUF4351 domain-containing protein [Nostoc sp. 2RC]
MESFNFQNLEALGEALLDFTTIDDLLNWLQAHLNETEN